MTELFRIIWPDNKFKYFLFDKVFNKETNKAYNNDLFSVGKKIEIEKNLYTNHEHWGEKYADFHYGVGDEYYINKNFVKCLKEVGEINYQLFPIDILPEKKSYNILNILNIIDCVDRKLSKYTLWTEEDNRPDLLGTFRSFDKMVLDRSKVPKGVHLFRVYGFDVVTAVTKELVEEFEKNKIKGFNLKPLD